jgi:hypothetical protein
VAVSCARARNDDNNLQHRHSAIGSRSALWGRDLDKPTRNHLFWCADNRNNIEAWRETLGPNERARL